MLELFLTDFNVNWSGEDARQPKTLATNKCEGNMAQGGKSHNPLTTAENKHHSLQGITEGAKEKKN